MQATIHSIFSIPNLLFCIFTYFVLQIRSAVKTFNGDSQLILLALNLYALIGTIAAIFYLGLVGYRTQWYTAVGVFLLATATYLSFGNFLSNRVKHLTLVFIGLIVVPIVGIIMYIYIPNSLN